jgi:hypothetical protein
MEWLSDGMRMELSPGSSEGLLVGSGAAALSHLRFTVNDK